MMERRKYEGSDGFISTAYALTKLRKKVMLSKSHEYAIDG